MYSLCVLPAVEVFLLLSSIVNFLLFFRLLKQFYPGMNEVHGRITVLVDHLRLAHENDGLLHRINLY